MHYSLNLQKHLQFTKPIQANPEVNVINGVKPTLQTKIFYISALHERNFASSDLFSPSNGDELIKSRNSITYASVHNWLPLQNEISNVSIQQ